jgi:hypothetical protein
MNSTGYVSPGVAIPSNVLWHEPPQGRIVMLGAALVMTCVGIVMKARLMYQIYVSGSLAVKNQAGARFTPVKVQQQLWILTLGLVMLLSGLIKMTFPEFAIVTNLVEVLYKVTAFHALYMFLVTQFGGIANLCRDDFSGTLQHHEEYKIWKAAPLCCIWVFCVSCMTPKRFTWRDAKIVGWCLRQFIILGPLMAVVLTIAQARQFSPNLIHSVMSTANTASLCSLLICAYGLNVLIGVAESCSHVSEQRPALTSPLRGKEGTPTWTTGMSSHCSSSHCSNHAADLNLDSPNQEMMSPSRPVGAPKKNLAPKMGWIFLITGLPALCAAFLPCFITSEYYSEGEGGGVLSRSSLELHWSGFIQVFFGFLGSLLASKAFPLNDNLLIPVEWFSARVLEAEVVPGFLLEHLSRVYTSIIDDRHARGADVNLGISPQFQNPLMNTP